MTVAFSGGAGAAVGEAEGCAEGVAVARGLAEAAGPTAATLVKKAVASARKTMGASGADCTTTQRNPAAGGAALPPL